MTTAWRFAATVGLLATSLAVSLLQERRGPQRLARPLDGIDLSIRGWQGTDDPPLADRIEASLAATAYLSRTYRRGSGMMNLFIAFYAQQRAGESMHSPKYCLPGGGWEMVDSGMVKLPVENAAVEVNNYLLFKGDQHTRMLYWYQGQRRVVADEYLAKVYLVWDALRYQRTSGSIVRITLDDRPEAMREGIEFASDVTREVGRCFGSEVVTGPRTAILSRDSR